MLSRVIELTMMLSRLFHYENGGKIMSDITKRVLINKAKTYFDSLHIGLRLPWR